MNKDSLDSIRASSRFLTNLLNERRRRNPAYSLRALARDLKIPASRASDILQGKRKISKRMALHLADQLDLSPIEARARLGVASHDPKGQGTDRYTYSQLDDDMFLILVDWYHFAILNLMDTCDFQSDSGWIGKRLGLKISTVDIALERLMRAKLIACTRGRYVKQMSNVATSDQVPNSAVRKAHRENLERAVDCLESLPVSLRDLSSVSMAIDVKKIAMAKAEIKRFRRRMARLMEQGKRSEVYSLNIQFIPVTKVRELE